MTVVYHESSAELSSPTRDIHRAIATLVEEWEAIDWYQQRMDVTDDEELRALLRHNRDEEIEHAAMALEWLRRKIPEVDKQHRVYLFKTESITEIEGGTTSDESATMGPAGLGIGKVNK